MIVANSGGLTVDTTIWIPLYNLADNLEVDVRNAAQKGILLPLTASENDILNAQYNIEYEDFMAVEQLVKQHGTSTYRTFIQNLKTENAGTDFQSTFHTTLDNFQNRFIKTL